ncbi:zinc finger protein 142 isoform X1 [Alosa sapidissima]|uniref:zinc finger protein 142 isoform X1 n=2 Tax=Alosa sapidissima TaxID=34773 RepID=UPI001C09D66D|nr:zinc finger protein 142 isoform X1 [Alosa sapidissima]
MGEEMDNQDSMLEPKAGMGLGKRQSATRKRRAQNCSTNAESVEEPEGCSTSTKSKTQKTSTPEAKCPSKGKGHIIEGAEHLYRTHICSECRRCFKTRSHLVEHMHLHFPDPSLQCPTCKHHFTSKSKLRIHMLRETGQKLHHCHLCEYGAVERNSLRRHLASVHGDQAGGQLYSDEYPCPTCGDTFRQSRMLKAHMKSHHTAREGQPLTCLDEDCTFQTTEKRELQRHMEDAHGIKAIECRHHACSALFRSVEAMEGHLRTHQAFHCSQCDFSCSNKSRFQQHKRQGHPGKEELHCDFCTFTTFNPVEFEQHVGHFHANEKIHRCQQCDFVTAHKRVLNRHMLMHTGEKPHKCKLCDFRCRDETYLSKHMLTHSDDKHHMCSECGYVTKWKHYLSVHMRKHAGDLRYKCNQCSYRCHRTDQLNSHKLRHQAKSLICEVCAYSCKRKSELRKHMQLKHSTGEQFQPPVFQCKYCPYQTRYRQALQNHENSKHTRNREFRCALCPYTTFSNTGLFLHKKKIHGYVPGDVEWLENYAEKERESNALDPLQSLFSKTAAASSGNNGSPTGNKARSQVDPNPCVSGSRQVLSDHQNMVAADTVVITICESQEQLSVESGTLETVVDNQTVPETENIEGQPSDDNQESCCTLVLTPVSDAECSQTGTDHAERLATVSAKPQSEGEKLQILTESVNDQNDVALEECEEQNDSEEPTEPPSSLPLTLSPPEHSPTGTSEAALRAMKKQDKEQAEALVLEGRVQMLVVQTQADVFRCEHCSYVTRKQTSLRQHCRSACGARKAVLLCCSDCGAKFKQSRGLNTHRLKKCPVLVKKGRKFSQVPPAGLDKPSDSTQEWEESQLSDQTNVNNAMCEQGSANNNMTNYPDADGSSVSDTNKASSGVTSTTIAPKQRCHAELSSEGDGQGYTESDGKFACKICSFSSSRIATIERHCTSCLTSKGNASPSKEGLESERDISDSDAEVRSEDGGGGNSNSEGLRKEKGNGHLSCPSCSFKCHQQRALASHRKRGCLKPNEIQCQFCSFVAKSQKALVQHVLVHKKEKPQAPTTGRKARLQCKSCPFSCKQERCMAQHVALKHEGARPYRCRFCAFSTTRRYRLDAHESLHTGLGRHACDLCSQTFGTTSKLRLHRQRVHDRQATHFCQLCDYSGYSLNDLSRHTLSCHTGELCHACGQCEARFSSETALKQHQNRRHQSRQTHTCAQCDFTCPSRSALKEHLQQEHPQLRCATCQVSFETPKSLEEHRKTHLTQRCPECPFATRKRQLLAQHLLEEHESGPVEDKSLKCEVCGFACRHQLVFEQHIRSHGGTRLYKCTDCQYSTRNRQKITWHIRIHTGEKPYHCEQCSYSCAEPSRLKYHMRIHQEERKYLCPECGYKCKWVSQLKYHMTKHTGAKPYACEECEYRTNRPDALRVHRETRHRDVRSFICEKCGKAFKTRFLLKTHQKKHSEERPFVCKLCSKAFRWAAGLKNHYLTHTNQQPYHCLHCSYRAKQKFQVVKHLQRHHPDQLVGEGVGRDPGAHLLTLQEARLTVPAEPPDNANEEAQQADRDASSTQEENEG